MLTPTTRALEQERALAKDVRKVFDDPIQRAIAREIVKARTIYPKLANVLIDRAFLLQDIAAKESEYTGAPVDPMWVEAQLSGEEA